MSTVLLQILILKQMVNFKHLTKCHKKVKNNIKYYYKTNNFIITEIHHSEKSTYNNSSHRVF